MANKEEIEKKYKISVVIPAHNEREGIAHALQVIEQFVTSAGVHDYELIVVDDGSSDGTYREIQEIRQRIPQVKGIRLSRNFGKEGALLAGLKMATGQAVISMDSDLQHPPKLIPEMISKWLNGCQIVHAVKRDRSADSWAIRMRARIFNTVYSKLGGVNIQNSSDFKLLDRTVVDILVNRIQERERFYRGLATWVGFKQDVVFFDVAPREVGDGKWSLWSLIELALTATISFTSAPLRIVTALGVISLFFGFIVLADTLWSWFHGRSVSGFATLEITLLLLGSFIMISLGIVGEYIAKIYQEIKARPLFIVEETCGMDDEQHVAKSFSELG
ncbi:MAG: glycosyltransferase family 2 protein [Desulforhopalus sp.]